MLGGFFTTPSVANYAAWVPLVFAIGLGASGVTKLVRQAKPSPFPWVLIAAAAESAVWFVSASGLP